MQPEESLTNAQVSSVHIHLLKLSHFMRFKQLGLQFPHPNNGPTCFVGKNDSSKSTVLLAIQIFHIAYRTCWNSEKWAEEKLMLNNVVNFPVEGLWYNGNSKDKLSISITFSNCTEYTFRLIYRNNCVIAQPRCTADYFPLAIISVPSFRFLSPTADAETDINLSTFSAYNDVAVVINALIKEQEINPLIQDLKKFFHDLDSINLVQ